MITVDRFGCLRMLCFRHSGFVCRYFVGDAGGGVVINSVDLI